MKVCGPMAGALSGRSRVRKPCRTRQRAGPQSRLLTYLGHKEASCVSPAEHPHSQRPVASGQHGAGEVVKAPSTRLAPVALPTRLRVVTPVPDYRIAAAAGAAHALGPAVLAHQREALGVV